MTNPSRKMKASSRFWAREVKMTYNPYIAVTRMIISYVLRVCEKNLAGVKITAPEKITASVAIR
jgi:hypothetical protein